MLTRSLFARTMDVLLVLCAIGTTGMMFRHFSHPLPAPAVPDGATRFAGWQEDLQFSRRIGTANAPYRLVVWTDYQCPACLQFEQEIKVVKAQLKDSLAVVYRYYPLAAHPLAFRAAVAAECARDQGRFADMHEALFAAHVHGDSLPISSLITTSGIRDIKRFRHCITDSTSAARFAVNADMARVPTLHLRGTPGVQIGDRISTGGLAAVELAARLRETPPR
jgi:protein-disulfide isomerase